MPSDLIDGINELIEQAESQVEEGQTVLERLIATKRTLRGNGRPAAKSSKPNKSPSSKPKSPLVNPGNRSDQVLEVIANSPGVSASQIAARLKIQPNYVYRLVKDLTKQKKVVKDKRLYSLA